MKPSRLGLLSLLVLFALALLVAGPAAVPLAHAAPATPPTVADEPEAAPSPEEEEEEPEEEGEEEEEPAEGEEYDEEEAEEEIVPVATPPVAPRAVPAPAPAPVVPPSRPPVVVSPPATPPAIPPSAAPVPAPPPPRPAAPPPAAAPPPTAAPTPAPVESAPKSASALPSNLRKIVERLAVGPLAQDPEGGKLIARMAAPVPVAADFNAMGIFLSRNAYFDDARAFLERAVGEKKDEKDYWLNLGTVQLQRGKLSAALTAYQRALKLDPNDAFTHYNIGVAHDYMRNYDRAVESFTRALALDPSLGDSRSNPAAVNNDRLLVVNLLLYQAKAGGMSMPLRGAEAARKPAPAKTR